MIYNRLHCINLVILSILFMIHIKLIHCKIYIKLPELPSDDAINNIYVSNRYGKFTSFFSSESSDYREYDDHVFKQYLNYILDNLKNSDGDIQTWVKKVDVKSTYNRLHEVYFKNKNNLRLKQLLCYEEYANAYNEYKKLKTFFPDKMNLSRAFSMYLPAIIDDCKHYVKNDKIYEIMRKYENPCKGENNPQWYLSLKNSEPIDGEIYETYTFRQLFYGRLPVYKTNIKTFYDMPDIFFDEKTFEHPYVQKDKDVNAGELLHIFYMKARDIRSTFFGSSSS